MNHHADSLRLVFWELTGRCNLKCRHCRAQAQASSDPDELSLDEIRDVALAIRQTADPIMILTGGEPLARKDFFDIAAVCSGLFRRVALATNGTLVDDQIARRITATGIQRVSISLDGAKAKTHDAFRGIPGSYAAALRGYDALARTGMPLQINTTVTRHNAGELDDLLQLALERKAAALHVFALVPVGCGAEIGPDARLSPAATESLLQWLCARAVALQDRIHIKATCAPQFYRIMRETGGSPGLSGTESGGGHGMQTMTRGCLAGSSVGFISRTGDVQPCGYLPVAVGNVRRQRFGDLWRDSPTFVALRNPARLKGKCGICGYRTICGGCRAQAYAASGDFLDQDSGCRFEPGSLRSSANPLLVDLQNGLPFEPSPLAAIGRPTGLSAGEVLACIRSLLRRGLARRFGAVFNPAGLGFRSTLYAACVPEPELEEAADRLIPHPGITHCYQRDARWNLWFTLTVPAQTHALEQARLIERLHPHPVACFPAHRVFKIRAVFDGNAGATSGSDAGDHRTPGGPTVVLDDRERAIVRRMQGSLPLTGDPFQTMATELGWEYGALLELLSGWRTKGVLRRIGLIMRHQRLGFKVNSMCVWAVDAARIAHAGQIVASSPSVSHCYERATVPEFPYNLYAMIHARSEAEMDRIIRRLARTAGLQGGQRLDSVREFKKSSPVFF